MDHRKWERVSEVIFRVTPETLRAAGGVRQTAQYLAGQGVLAVAVDRRLVGHMEYWAQDEGPGQSVTILSAWVDPDYVSCRLFQRLAVAVSYIHGVERLTTRSEFQAEGVADAAAALESAASIVKSGQSKVLRCLVGP